jgi:hypothetical protein
MEKVQERFRKVQERFRKGSETVQKGFRNGSGTVQKRFRIGSTKVQQGFNRSEVQRWIRYHPEDILLSTMVKAQFALGMHQIPEPF